MTIEMQKSTNYLAIHKENVDIFFTVNISRLTYNAFQVWKSFFLLLLFYLRILGNASSSRYGGLVSAVSRKGGKRILCPPCSSFLIFLSFFFLPVTKNQAMPQHEVLLLKTEQ